MLCKAIAAGAAAALLAGAAYAEGEADMPQNQAAEDAASRAAPAASDEPREVVRLSSGSMGDINQLKAGDPGVTSNGPVPDTPENRARYGEPLSQTGKRTPADGS